MRALKWITILLLVCIPGVACTSPTPSIADSGRATVIEKNDTFTIIRDDKTGCQYIRSMGNTPFIPMIRNGSHGPEYLCD